MPTSSQADIDRIIQLIQYLPADQYSTCLFNLVHQLVPLALVGDVSAPETEPEEAVDDYIRDRLGRAPSDAFAAALISIVRENDADFDRWIFPDGPEQVILVADTELQVMGEEVLERYLDYRDNYPEYEVIHPSDDSGPKEEDEDEEWARHVSDFADLVRDWRNRFLRGLMEDVARVSAA